VLFKGSRGIAVEKALDKAFGNNGTIRK